MSTMIIEMEVDMDCPGCERKVKKALRNVDGVEEIDIDMDNQKVTVTGWATQEKVLKAVRRTGRTAELWTYPNNNPEFMQNLNVQYYQQHPPSNDQQGHDSTYDYSPNSSNDSSYNSYDYYEPGYYSRPASVYSNMFSEQGTAVFSDDNPNACSIM